MAKETASGLRLVEALTRHMEAMEKLGLPRDGHLFGNMGKPKEQLKDASTILRRLRHLYFPELAKMGVKIPDSVRFSGHSFRRGGINAIRDGARRAGVQDAALATLLMRFGRWRDPSSLLTYLKDDWVQQAKLTARI